ncbi:hypothetical protein RUM44_003121 [Polyplax serrata]|uniref:BAI1-associated protein 3 n=1 Tax=Polyplax serrata TaxID=468196 RepID=A0ABR1AY24_POLSC
MFLAQGRSWEWTGELPQVALTIIHQHAIQGDVTDLQLALVKWVAYSKTNHERFLDPKILYRLLQEMDQIWTTETLSKEEEECLAENFTSFVEYSLYLVRRHRILFPPQQRATMTRFDYLLRCLGLMANMKAFWKCCPFHKEIRGEIILALKKGTAEWYEETQVEALRHSNGRDATLAQSDANKVDHSLQALTHFVTVLLVDLQTGIQAFNPLFEHTNNVQYFNVVYKQLEKMLVRDVQSVISKFQVVSINHDMGPTVSQLCSTMATTEDSQTMPHNANFGTPVFELYFALQEFVSLKENLNISDQKSLSINNYNQWFEPAIEQWLHLAKIKALYRIKAAFELSRMVTGERIVKHSTSAIDATACFYQIQEFWRQLAWPDLFSAYNFVMTIIDIITSSSLYFSDLVQQKLHDSGYYEDTGTFKVSDEMCISVNDLEYVRRFLNTVGTSLSVESILDAVESTCSENPSQWRDALYGLLEETKLNLEARALQIMSKMGTKMRPSLKKVMFHLAWSPDSLPTSEAISPLLELLDGYLVALNAALLPRNFERSLADIWDTVLLELGNQVDSTSGEKVTGFYDRLYEALDILVDFFHAEEKGLSMEILKSATYWQVEQRLSYHRTATDKLISLFYQQRLTDQINMETSEYGVLSVRAYFNHDSLCVEVLNARDVIPLDPNGFSDPFVIVELLPRKVFAHCTEQQTNVHKKTLNPMFDECFEFSVTLEQCKSEAAMILFTVMDHDVLTSNDFAGEAFLNLQTIPGVADNSSSVDNFHGLKTQDLNLMHQKNRNHPILQILETRTWDRPAQEFVKKQKLRFATSS